MKNIRALWIAGIVLLGLTLLGLRSNPAQFFSAYLIAFLLWLGVALGSTSIWMLYNLVGGQWGALSLPIWRAASRTLPLMLLLFIPLLFALPVIYPWASGAAPHHLLDPMRWYLNKPFFYGRAVVCFLCWIGFAWILGRWQGRRELLSALGIVVFAFTISIAVFDWVLSLDLYNRSTIFGLLVIIGQVLSAFAFTILILVLAKNDQGFLPLGPFHDLGNFLLTCVILWAYFSYAQLVIIWSGQMSEEVVWYNHRFLGGWGSVGVVLLIGNFIIPFALLLFRPVKRNPMLMARLALFLVFMQWINTVWLVLPSVSPMKFSWSWMQFVAPLGIGALWLANFLTAWNRSDFFGFRFQKGGQHGNA